MMIIETSDNLSVMVPEEPKYLFHRLYSGHRVEFSLFNMI